MTVSMTIIIPMSSEISTALKVAAERAALGGSGVGGFKGNCSPSENMYFVTSITPILAMNERARG